jgi:hypothetical protein
MHEKTHNDSARPMAIFLRHQGAACRADLVSSFALPVQQVAVAQRAPPLATRGHSKNCKARMLCQENIRAPGSFQFRFRDYFGITSRANLLATTSRISLRFFPASIMASREP